MRVVGMDIDGVLAKNPWEMQWHWPLSGKPVCHRFFRFWLAGFYYLYRAPNQDAKRWALGQKKEGNKLLIISSVWAICRPVTWFWLKRCGIPFDGLILRWRGTPQEFKARAVSRRCSSFVDDQMDVILAIAKIWIDQGFFRQIVISHLDGFGYLLKLEGGAKVIFTNANAEAGRSSS